MDYYKMIAKKIADSIEINHEKRKIMMPFISSRAGNGLVTQGKIIYNFWYTEDYLSMPEFPIYLEDRYGIPNKEGILRSMRIMLYKFIKERLNDELRGKPLTESKNGKERFIDIVVKELSDDTIYHYDEKRGNRSPIDVPWGNSKMRITFHYFIDLLTHPFAWEDGPFKSYVVSTYGVSDEDVEPIWLNYKEVMNDRYFGGEGIKQSSLTENEDKQQKYINYIIDDMVKKTRVKRDERMISFPFHDHGRYKGFYDEFINAGMLQTMETFFHDYITERYGTISPMEKFEIWTGYTIKVSDLVYGMKHG